MTFWQRAQNLPPVLCRLLARDRRYGKPLTTPQIAERSGLSPIVVEALSCTTSWESVPLSNMQQFIRGCGLDFCDSQAMRRVEDYLRKHPTFHHLTSAPNWEGYYMPLVKQWREGYGRVNPEDPDIWPPIRELLVRLSPLLTLRK